MKVFIASPLFNAEQHEILNTLESLLQEHGHEFYSARHDSEGLLPPKEMRGNHEAWKPVFQNNLDGLNDCDVMIAVLNYALPSNQRIILSKEIYDKDWGLHLEEKEIELPDSGTVWEMGYFTAFGKPVYGYHPTGGSHLNLMLTHGCTETITGEGNLRQFLAGDPFDFSACVNWGAQNGS